MERVDDQAAFTSRGLVLRCSDQKVAWEVHALEPKSGAPSYFQVDNRERDGNAGTTIEHLVETTVARILVPIAVAGEPLVGEQVLIEPMYSTKERAVSGLLDVSFSTG